LSLLSLFFCSPLSSMFFFCSPSPHLPVLPLLWSPQPALHMLYCQHLPSLLCLSSTARISGTCLPVFLYYRSVEVELLYL
jgi:hypothetical protein